MSLHLGLDGHKVSAVGDGREGLRLAQESPFELLVLDLMLPGLDGVSLCRAVRREGPNRDDPILMLTARGRNPTKSWAWRAVRTTTSPSRLACASSSRVWARCYAGAVRRH